jgi:DNA polymerase
LLENDGCKDSPRRRHPGKVPIGTTDGIMRLRGRWVDYSLPDLPAPVPAMPIFHPAFLLRQPAMKREAWRDLVQIRKRLG